MGLRYKLEKFWFLWFLKTALRISFFFGGWGERGGVCWGFSCWKWKECKKLIHVSNSCFSSEKTLVFSVKGFFIWLNFSRCKSHFQNSFVKRIITYIYFSSSLVFFWPGRGPVWSRLWEQYSNAATTALWLWCLGIQTKQMGTWVPRPHSTWITASESLLPWPSLGCLGWAVEISSIKSSGRIFVSIGLPVTQNCNLLCIQTPGTWCVETITCPHWDLTSIWCPGLAEPQALCYN